MFLYHFFFDQTYFNAFSVTLIKYQSSDTEFIYAYGHEKLVIRKVQSDLKSIEAIGKFRLDVDNRARFFG